MLWTADAVDGRGCSHPWCRLRGGFIVQCSRLLYSLRGAAINSRILTAWAWTGVTMKRRNVRLRREYLYRKSLEGKEKAVYERKQAVRTALRGRSLPAPSDCCHHTTHTLGFALLVRRSRRWPRVLCCGGEQRASPSRPSCGVRRVRCVTRSSSRTRRQSSRRQPSLPPFLPPLRTHFCCAQPGEVCAAHQTHGVCGAPCVRVHVRVRRRADAH